ncbi:hypothetical protein CP967_31280 [Streptomyces nitrosporeus]|uniref:Uncharacterized protein n=1 Tax=Streptomyces nitrosporeus TaxID=28894 RepID=A0A5J6FI15_9ACTN|nr:hypothetical protein [Streptomyces nitrosporeus]QEU75853.1 hypothetical protein CP967_31280 [Streptomyces nitrosporeus]GGY88813.1 hypothetical protein GCM10010327_19430 [Streptomyces nitrosporeus]
MTTFGEYRTTYRSDDRATLLCVGLCRRRKPRDEFRTTPWHGKAASCIRCETFPGPAGRSLWQIEHDARVCRDLEQAREKLRMYQRYAAKLRAERYASAWVAAFTATSPTSADAFEAHKAPFNRAVETRRQKWAPLIEEALSKAHTLVEEEAWQTPTT